MAAPSAYPDLPQDYPEPYEEQKTQDPPYELFLPRSDQTKNFAKLDEEWKAGLVEVQAYRRATSMIVSRKPHSAPE